MAYALGITATAVTLAAYLSDRLNWLEYRTLDWRFRVANSIPQHPDLKIIEIDDASLQKFGRWPWPRDLQAALVSIAAELGARRLVIDLNYVEPESYRAETPSDLDMFFDVLELADEIPPGRFSDEELRLAIAGAGNVYLAVYYEEDAWEHSADFAAARAAVAAGAPDVTALAAERRISVRRARDLIDAARIAAVLEKNIMLDDAAAAKLAGVDPEFALTVFERCRHATIRSFVHQRLADDASLRAMPVPEITRELYLALTGRNPENETPQRAALASTLREHLGYEATIRGAFISAEAVRAVAPEADRIVPVYFPLARAARRCGFVKFEPDSDGVMRRQALFTTHGTSTLAQLAFAVALDELGVQPGQIDIQPGRVRVRLPESRGGGALELQLDEHGRAVVPWSAETNWQRQFGVHLPADALLQVHDRRTKIEHNLTRRTAERDNFFSSNLVGADPVHQELLEARRAAEFNLLKTRYRGDDRQRAAAAKRLSAIRAELAARESALLEMRRAELETLRRANDPASSARLADMQYWLEQLPKLEAVEAEVDQANARLGEEIERTIAWLRPHIEGKICLIGYTATALADMTPIPTNPRAPGVMAHAAMLSGLLTGRTVAFTTRWPNSIFLVLAGAAMTFVSANYRPRTSLLIFLGVIALLLLTAAAAFYFWTLHVVIAPAAIAMFAAYTAIAFYRYVFIDRERRQLATSLGQYTSSALARQMAENADLCRRAETREVTAMFTDLAGFTSISEQIGAERTQRVLNVSLGRISDVMLRHEAMINKFIGDGVFAFWNPLIYPQADHADRACATAVELLAEMDALIDEQRRMGGDPTFLMLHLRIGLACGRAVVGPCGSEQKYDYTCIGDSVNVASRLESANKVFGTRVLTNDATRDRVNGAFVFRGLGSVRVKGRSRPVGVYELLGPRGAVPPERCAYAERFGEAVHAFQQRSWDAAIARFDRCLREQPQDRAADLYLRAARAYRDAPPSADWEGEIELAEK